MSSPTAPDRLQADSLTAQIIRTEIWQRANVQNEHFILCIVGREGSGKSGTALSLAAALDPGFHAERVCFAPADVLRLIDSNETSRGSVIALDEAGVGMGSRSWYDEDQIQLNKTLQTIRDDNQILILTLPSLDELDSQTQKRLHGYAEMTSLEEGEAARFKFKFLHPQRGPSGDIYEEYPRRRVNGRRAKVTRLQVGPPPADLWSSYQTRKSDFKEDLYADTIEALEDDGADEQKSATDVADDILSNGGPEEYIKEVNGGTQVVLDKNLIAAKHDLGQGTAKQVKSLLLEEVDDDVM